MLWCIARLGYIGMNDNGNVKHETTELRIFDTQTFQWIDTGVESVKAVLAKRIVPIGNLRLGSNRTVGCVDYFAAKGSTGINSGGCGLAFIDKEEMPGSIVRMPVEDSRGVEIAYLTNTLSLFVLWDGSFRVGARGLKPSGNDDSIYKEDSSPFIARIRERLKGGNFVSRMEKKAAVLAVDCDIVDTGQEIVYTGLIGKGSTVLDKDINVPNGVTTIANGAIATFGKVTLPKSVVKLERDSIKAREVEINGEIKKAHKSILIVNGSDTFKMPSFDPNADVKEMLGDSPCTKIIYPDYGKVYTYADKALMNNVHVTDVDILNTGDIRLGEFQFFDCIGLENLITPNGHITEIGVAALCDTAIRNIDLSECRYIGRYAFRAMKYCNSGKYPYQYKVNNRPLRTVEFKYSTEICAWGIMGAGIGQIVFLGDNLTLERDALMTESKMLVVYCTSNKVRELLEQYRAVCPGQILRIERLGR